MASSTAAAAAPEPITTTPSSGHVVPETAIFVTDKCYARPYLATDAELSAPLANDAGIARWMRNGFPHPYTLDDARRWIGIVQAEAPTRHFALVAPDGTFVGDVGLKPREDVEARTAELGYWMGRPYWGRGIATAAVRAFVRWTFRTFPDLLRLEAAVYAGNAGSAAVLRKVGFVQEGVLRQAVFKNGEVLDLVVYGLLRQDVELGESGPE